MISAGVSALLLGLVGLVGLGIGGNSEAEKRVTVAPTTSGRFYLTPAEIRQMRTNIGRFEWARVAWENTKDRADDALDERPNPADPRGDYRSPGSASCKGSDEGWRCGLYGPGLQDGHRARDLALAYAVTGETRYATKAKEFLLAWATEYNPVPSRSRTGHYVAEPVGPTLKMFMAYDLVQATFSARERTIFRDWARQFIAKSKSALASTRNKDRTAGPFGNGAQWQRANVVMAAAVVGGQELRDALAWNWENKDAGHDNGWLFLMDGIMDASGKMREEDHRQSISYALYTWHPLTVIAGVARNAGFQEDLFGANAPGGKSLQLAAEHYAPYLTGREADPYANGSDPLQSAIREYRAAYELAARLAPRSGEIRSVVRAGGPLGRGDNYDPHLTAFNALTGIP